MADFEKDIKRAASAIADAEALLFTSGAGMGVDSGLPDFRGNTGFWKAYPPYASRGLSFVDMANPQWFHSDPEFAWGFYGHRLNLYRETVPHRGFSLLLDFASRKKYPYFVFTSNVDGQFQKAGFDEDNIDEVHGSIHHFQCLNDCGIGIFSAEPYQVEVLEKTMRAKAPLPECPQCGSLVRPNILMFGDWQFDGQRQAEQAHRMHHWFSSIPSGGLVVIECGAGGAVPTVRMTSEGLARRNGGTLIRINIREPAAPAGSISIAMPALQALTLLSEKLL